jgi:outer membrane protein assembly factor BamB
VTFDRACPLIAVGDAVFYASSAEDQVVCLDRESGKTRWRYFAEAPVRLAPTYDHGRVLFGSDDGCVYCVSASDGSLMWKHRLVETDRQIPGNGRVISVWPVRSGVLVDDGKAFFCAGLFPEQGIFQAAIDVATGKLIARNQIGISAQGYLERKGSRLHVATGRDPAGSFVSTLSRRGKGIGKEVRSIPEKYPYAFIGDSRSRFAGGHNELAAFDAESGETVWHANVDGHAHSMAISQSCLLVSTDEGMIYCFGESTTDAVHNFPQPSTNYPWKSNSERETVEKLARTAIEAAGTRRGWTLIVNSGDGTLAAELARQSDFKIVCVEDDADSIATSRSVFDAMGLSGRVVVHKGNPDGRLPYTDYLFNLVVDAAAAAQQGGDRLASTVEAKRVTRPHGGVAILGPTPDDVFRRSPLPGVGEWTHQYADPGNTVCSGDTLVKGDMRLQWFGAPGPRGMMDRHHRTAAPLWSNGRLFVPGDNRVVAADGYNGTPLWNIDVPESRRAGVYRDCSYLAASGDSLYVSAADGCLHIDAHTGKQLHAFAVPDSNNEAAEWGYLATVNDLLFGSRQKKGSSRRDHSRDQIEEGTYFDARPLVCSEEFFALERKTGEVFWKYRPSSGPIVNSTIAVADSRVYFVESTDESLNDSKTGRHKAASLFRLPAQLTALDMRTGSLLWKKPIDLKYIEHTIYLSAVRGRIVINGSFNKLIAAKSKVHVDVSVFNAEDGSRIWQRTQNNQANADGAHGEQDLHPVIVDNRLYCEPFAYDLQTGEPLPDWKWNAGRRRGCGTISASASTFFFRHSHPTMFDLTGNSYSKITTSTRPGCWINMIPAGGLLLIPEGSSGCSCNYAIQSSMAFLPFGK